jgi:transposase
MRDKDLYATILGVEAPWLVSEVELRGSAEEVEVYLAYDAKAPLHCPTCGGVRGRHDTRRRSWRHLDTCQFKTVLTAEVPRVNSPSHGVLQINVPWAERGSRFTAMFESLAIDW